MSDAPGCPPELAPASGRRTALKALGATLGAGAFAAAMAPLRKLNQYTSVDEFLQQHDLELTPEALARTLRRIEDDTLQRHGATVHVRDARPQEGVYFGYALNLSVCIGCRRCADACHQENNHDRTTNNSYIRVFEMTQGSFDFEKGNASYDHPVPAPGKYYMPVQCQQCDNPPCVDVCPVKATWKERDGIVVVDYDWCIGCRYCEAACPYHARRFNWSAPKVPVDEINPEQAYLSNRTAPAGRDGEVHVLSAPHARRASARLPRGLPDRRAGLRQPARSRERDPLGPGQQAGLRPEGGARDETELLLLLRRLRSR
jgi:Fe-S-cluster-containing dehydrogenase component